VEGYTDKEVLTNRTNSAAAEAEEHTRGRGWQQRSEGDRHHDNNYENMGSFNVEIVKEIRNSQVEVNISENGKVEWILDSGCIDHIINNESYFTNYVYLKNPITVKEGNGRSVQATKAIFKHIF